MPLFDRETFFEDLPLRVYRRLVEELNKNSAWKIIAKCLVKKYNFLGTSWIDSLEKEAAIANTRQSPAELLLHDLLQKNTHITVGIFCDVLKYCDLLDALSILHGPDSAIIVEHPYHSSDGKAIEVSIGDTFPITCKVAGLLRPSYQWFHGNIELPDQTDNSLSLVITSPDQQGDYKCRVSLYNDTEEIVSEQYSKCTSLTIKPRCLGITGKPESVEMKSASSENKSLPHEDGSPLRIIQCQPRDEGRGNSQIAAKNINELLTDKKEVTMDYLPQKAKSKVALLIANGDYQNGQKLRTAENDAAVIAILLRKIGFHVICLQNLTLKEMRNAVQIFCAALMPDSYGLFYFVGHGFKMNGYHMMPIDVREAIHPNDVYSQEEFLSGALEKIPALLVVILDMPLKGPQKKLNSGMHDIIPKSCELKFEGTLILAYSTCSYKDDVHDLKDVRNGIYASHLARHITNNKPVCEMFMGVAQSVAAVTQSMNTEARCHGSTLINVPAAPQRYLTDPVICESSPSPCNSYLTDLTTFRPVRLRIRFPQSSVSCEVTIQPLTRSYLNVVLLTTSGLEEWDVSFHNSPNSRVNLCPMGRKCSIHNPQGITASSQGSLVIKIGKNGKVHKSIRFFYMKYIPQLVNALWREYE